MKTRPIRPPIKKVADLKKKLTDILLDCFKYNAFPLSHTSWMVSHPSKQLIKQIVVTVFHYLCLSKIN